MIVVAFIVIVAFAWFFNPYDTRQGSLNQAQAFRMGNQGVTIKEIDRQRRILMAADEMGFPFITDLLAPGGFDVVEFTQNRLLLRGEARKLGIEPDEEEVNKAITEHQHFQNPTTSQYDEERYLDAVENTLQPNGLTAGDLRKLVADQLAMEKLNELLGSNLEVPESLVDMEYQRENEKVTASLVTFKKADFEEKIAPTDEELQAYFDELKDDLPSKDRRENTPPSELSEDERKAIEVLLSPEKREVAFAFFEEPKRPLPSQPATTTPSFDPLAPPPLLTPGTPSVTPGNTISLPPAESIQLPPAESIELPPAETIELPPAETIELPPAETIELPPADDESEPPGQAPTEETEATEESEPTPDAPTLGLDESNTILEAEPLPDAPEMDLDNLDLPTPEELGASDFDGAGLTDDPQPKEQPVLDLTNESGLAEIQPTEEPVSSAVSVENYEAKRLEYQKRVDEFYTKLLAEPDSFETLAQEYNVDYKTAGPFDQAEPPTDPTIPTEVVTAIFNARPETNQGVIDPPQGISPKGYYVVRILNVEEPAELSFEDAKEKLTESLKARDGATKLEELAKESHEKLAKAIEEGKSFADAAKELELEVREVDEFSSSKRPTGDHSQQILAASGKTTTGAISEVTDAADDKIIVYVSQRVMAPEEKAATNEDGPKLTPTPGSPPPAAPLDPDQAKENLSTRLLSQAESSMFDVWLADRRSEAQIVRDLDRVPAVPFVPASLRRFFQGGGF